MHGKPSAQPQTAYPGDPEPGRVRAGRAGPTSEDERAGWVVNRAPTARWQGVDLAEAWRYRELAWMLALRTFKLRYRQTFFGVAWALLQPLVALGIFALIFGRFARLPSDGIPYAVFVFPALCLWTYVSTAVSAAALELVSHQELVTKVYFPRVLAPISALLPGIVDLMISLSLTGAMMALAGVAPGVAIVLLPAWILMGCLVALGCGLWLAALNVRYRDVRQTLPFLLQTWFFVSPVVYASSIVTDGWLRGVLALNPMVGVIDGLRWSLLDAPAPPLVDLLSIVVTVLLVISGLVYFKASERRFADVI